MKLKQQNCINNLEGNFYKAFEIGSFINISENSLQRVIFIEIEYISYHEWRTASKAKKSIKIQIFIEFSIFILMILFVILTILEGQKLMIDSRNEYKNHKKLTAFSQNFSIWFTYHDFEEQYDVFTLINANHLLLKGQIIFDRFQILNNNNKIIDFQEIVLKNNEWYHIIITNYIQEELIFVQFSNTKKTYSSKIIKFMIEESSVIVDVKFNLNLFCLIYDQVVNQIEPIIQTTNFQTLLVQPEQITVYEYYVNSYFETFIRRHNNIQIDSYILQIKQGELILQIQDLGLQLAILSYQFETKYFNVSFDWFRVIIQFKQDQIEIHIELKDSEFSLQLEQIYNSSIFYKINLQLSQLNFQLMKYTSYFNFQNSIPFDRSVHKNINNCETEFSEYFDYETNSCKSYTDLDQFQYSKLNDSNNPFSQQQKYLLNSDQNNYLDLQDIIQNDYNEDQLYIKPKKCQKFYFGRQCKQFKKACLKFNNSRCIKCKRKYCQIQNLCKKCPQGCLICVFDHHRLQCLIPLDFYLINIEGQVKICDCFYCNSLGKCMSTEDGQKQINQCFNETTCVIKKCQTSQYFSIQNQNCTFSDDKLQSLYQTETDFDEQYNYTQRQYQIIQSSYQYGSQGKNYQELDDFYYNIQMYLIFEAIQLLPLRGSKSFELNMYNLRCLQKQLDENGDTVCKNFQEKKVQKCRELPCVYKLDLSNITYYLGINNYLEYDGFIFESIYQLLDSVKVQGMIVAQVSLSINLVFIENTENDTYKIFLFKNKLECFAKSEFNVSLQFSTFFGTGNPKILLNLQADSLIIQNQILNFQVEANIQLDVGVFIYNVSIGQNGQLRIISQFIHYCHIAGIELSGLLVFMVDSSYIFLITNYVSKIGAITKFSILNCTSFIIEESLIIISQPQAILNINRCFKFLMKDLIIQLIQIRSDISMCISSYYASIQNLTLFGDYLQDSQIFQISGVLAHLSFIQIKIQILINSYILEIYSQQVYINDLSIQSMSIYTNNLIFISAKVLTIKKLSINQQDEQFIQFQQQQNSYFLYFSVEKCEITQLIIEGLILDHIVLLSIQSQNLVKVEHFQLSKIFCFNIRQNNLIMIRMLSALSVVIIENLIFEHIMIKNMYSNIQQLIQIQESALIYFKQFIMNKISLDDDDYSKGCVFQIDCQNIFVQNLNFTDCRGLNFMNVKADSLIMSNFYFQNNIQNAIFNIVDNNLKKLKIKNSSFNIIDCSVLFIQSINDTFVELQNIKFIIHLNFSKLLFIFMVLKFMLQFLIVRLVNLYKILDYLLIKQHFSLIYFRIYKSLI